MNDNKLHKNSAIFLATLLVAGIIGMSSPMIASAQEYGYEDKKYDSYDPYMSDRKDGKSSSNVQIANCELSLSNSNFIDQDSNRIRI